MPVMYWHTGLLQNITVAEGLTIQLPGVQASLPDMALMDFRSDMDTVNHEHVMVSGLTRYPLGASIHNAECRWRLKCARYTTMPLKVI
jgi:tetrahydromethanopterin S-methyltransferase subunit H